MHAQQQQRASNSQPFFPATIASPLSELGAVLQDKLWSEKKRPISP